MIQKFQFAKISGILYYVLAVGMRSCLIFACFRKILAMFHLMGTLFSSGLTKGGEAVQVVRQVFQADLDFRAAGAFREDLSALVCQFAHDSEHVLDTAANS